jgi:opacity protein-like surface antigen
MKRFSLLFVLALSFLFTGHIASAQAKGYAGVTAGFSVPDADDTSGRPMFGVVGGARLDGEWGFGGFYMMSSKEESADGNDFDFDYSIYGIEGSFHMEGIADGAFVAARVGLAKVEVGSAGATENYSPFAWGIGLGYDYFFTEQFSAGLEAGMMNVQGADGTPDLDSFTMINFLVAAKMWF